MHTVTDRVSLIEERLKEALHPSFLNIRDDSQQHAGHASAKATGGGHYSLTIVSTAFEGKGLVQRHKLVYSALEGLIGKEIHAIQINAKTPEEHQK